MALGYVLLGEEVFIHERIPLVEAFDGLFHYWYKVSAGPYTGYILGAHLAVDYFDTANGIKHILQFTKPSEGHPGEVDIEIKSIRAVGQEPVGTLSTRLAFEPNDMLKAKVFYHRGLKNYDQVVILERWVDQCPYYFQETALLYRGGTFILLPTTALEKTGCTAHTYIFPEDYNGIPDTILIHTQTDTLSPKRVKLFEKSPGHFLPVKE